MQLCLKKWWWRDRPVASPGFCVYNDLGAEGASIDAPKAPSGVGYGEECALPSRLGGLEAHRELPLRGPGRAPAAIAFSACFRPQNASGSKNNTNLNLELLDKLQIPLWKSGGEPPLSLVTTVTYKVAPMQIISLQQQKSVEKIR